MVKNLIHCSAQYRPRNPTSVTESNPTVSFHRTACTLLPGRRHLDPLPKDQCPYDQDRHCVEQPEGIDEGARKMNSGSQVTARGWWWWLEREELLQNSLVVLAARPAIREWHRGRGRRAMAQWLAAFGLFKVARGVWRWDCRRWPMAARPRQPPCRRTRYL